MRENDGSCVDGGRWCTEDARRARLSGVSSGIWSDRRIRSEVSFGTFMRIDGDSGLEYDLIRLASARAAACGAGSSAAYSQNTLAHTKSQVLLTFVKIGFDRLIEVRSQQAGRGLYSGFIRCIFGTE